MGRAYSRPTTGTARHPHRNAFSTPPLGAYFSASCDQNWRFCDGQRTKLREMVVRLYGSENSCLYTTVSEKRSVTQSRDHAYECNETQAEFYVCKSLFAVLILSFNPASESASIKSGRNSMPIPMPTPTSTVHCLPFTRSLATPHSELRTPPWSFPEASRSPLFSRRREVFRLNPLWTCFMGHLLAFAIFATSREPKSVSFRKKPCAHTPRSPLLHHCLDRPPVLSWQP